MLDAPPTSEAPWNLCASHRKRGALNVCHVAGVEPEIELGAVALKVLL
jgi:hypothetical protein